jgi:hypothetical protein
MVVLSATEQQQAAKIDAAIYAHVGFSPNTPDSMGGLGSLTR